MTDHLPEALPHLDAIQAALAPYSLALLMTYEDSRGVWGQLQADLTETSIKIWPIGPFESVDHMVEQIIDTAETCQSQGVDAVNIFSAAMFEYLSAEMLNGKTVTMTIKSVTEEEVTGPRGTDSKVIVRFTEKPKLWVLNKTNARALADYLGPETNNWIGARVTLKAEDVRVGRNMVQALRVAKIAHQSGGKSAPAPATVDTYPEFSADDLADMTDPEPVAETAVTETAAPAQDNLFPDSETAPAMTGAYSE